MTTWTDVTPDSTSYSASLVSDGYVVEGYVESGYISSADAWTAVSPDTTVWA